MTFAPTRRVYEFDSTDDSAEEIPFESVESLDGKKDAVQQTEEPENIAVCKLAADVSFPITRRYSIIIGLNESI